MPTIHRLAIVEKGAELADNVIVGPFCHVGPDVVLGSGTELISHVSVMGRTSLGTGNTVWPFAVLGGDPQDLKFHGEDSELIIGDDNDIRESVTIHKGTANDNNQTIIGSRNLIMAYAHIGHDCVLGDHLVIANSVQMAGHVKVEDHAAVGGATAIHHFCTISSYAYVGGATRVTNDVPPFMIVEGNPARVRGVNVIGLKRHGFDEKVEDALWDAYRRLYRGADGNGVGAMSEAIETLEKDAGEHPQVRQLLDALHRATQGLHGRYRESLRRDDRYSNAPK